MEADPSEMSQHTYQTTMHHIPHDSYQHRHWEENLKSSLHLLLHGNIHTPLTSACCSTATYYSTPIIMFHRPQPTRTTTGKSCDDKLEYVQSRLPCVIRCSLVVCTPGVAPMCWHASQLLTQHMLPPASHLSDPTLELCTGRWPPASPSSPEFGNVNGAGGGKPTGAKYTQWRVWVN